MTSVIVVYASRHGATAGIAERIGEVLRGRGLETRVVAATERPDPADADAIVLGSAAYMGKWLEEASAYAKEFHEELRARPTWLFSSGPVGSERVDKQGHDVLAAPPFLTALGESIGARDTKVFFGRWDPSDPPTTVAERLFRLLPVSKELLPVGDYREWDAVEAWAEGVAEQLLAASGEPMGARAAVTAR